MIADEHFQKTPRWQEIKKHRPIVNESLVTTPGKLATENDQIGTGMPLSKKLSIPFGSIDCRNQYFDNNKQRKRKRK
jgi:hypothetical protein